ncbi:hypothetical protein EYF80_054267 [Liparis tanakae]|uniref:Uncharacterized protein n=1 Tax=Liparis tanakae TaxID=230148 RepID=A0A4Z2F3V8_9TELE|nr:hypothetical protein EYF80_054267 [Liparis tanakae]
MATVNTPRSPNAVLGTETCGGFGLLVRRRLGEACGGQTAAARSRGRLENLDSPWLQLTSNDPFHVNTFVRLRSDQHLENSIRSG